MTANIIYYFFSYFVVSFCMALALVPLMRPVAFKIGAVDRGTGRRVHQGIIPRLGGIGIFLAFSIPVVFSLTRGAWDAFHGKMVGILAGSAVIFLIGIYDDIKGARISTKLIAEISAALVIYFWGIRISLISNPFGHPLVLGWLSLPVTVLWIIIITNAINLIDGLDGLAAGTGILISLIFFSLAGNDTHMRLVYIILTGSLLGFLRYNFPPASIFMGDSGSLFIGFFLASISIVSSQKAAAMATMMIPMIAFSLPLMDMLYAVMRRYYRGIALGKADREHIHHKLLEKGFTKRKALFILYSINTGIMLLVLSSVRRQLNVDFLGLILIAFLAVLGVKLLGYVEFIPLIRNTIANYSMGRKRRYYDYVVGRFRNSAAKSESTDDLKRHLNALLSEYNFNVVKIVLNKPFAGNTFYVFNKGEQAQRSLTISFPIITQRGNCLGEIQMSKVMDGDRIAFTPELITALSEEVGNFVTKRLYTE